MVQPVTGQEPEAPVTGTPGQAAYEAFATVALGAMVKSEPFASRPASERGAWSAAALAGHRAIAAAPQPAPGPDVCECGHYRAHHAFSDDVCAVVDCPCTRPRPVPQPAPEPGGLREALAEQVTTWRDHAADMATGTRDEMTEGYAAGECAKELAAILDEHPEPQPAPASASQVRRHAEQRDAPELAAAMAEVRQLRNWLDDFTHVVIDLGEARVAYPAEAIRKKAGLPPVTT